LSGVLGQLAAVAAAGQTLERTSHAAYRSVDESGVSGSKLVNAWRVLCMVRLTPALQNH